MNTETTTEPNGSGRFDQDAIRKYSIAAGLILLAFIAFAFLANNSLPGSAFYGVKVNFIETFVAGTKGSDEAKAAYQVTLMEKRLEEVKKLSEKSPLKASARESLSALMKRHTQALAAAVTLTGEEVPSVALLNSVRQFADASAAIEQLSEEVDHLQEFAETAEDVRRDASNLYKDLIDRYAERETQENIFNFIKTQLSDISRALDDPSLSQGTVDDAEVYINRVSPAMAEGDYPRAIGAIAEAMRFIQIEKYGVRASESTSTTTDDGVDTATTTSTTTENAPLEEEAPVSTPSTPSFTFPD
jgi:hypothetical protein